MKIIKRGSDRVFINILECPNCHSVLGATDDEIKFVRSAYNKFYYAFYCPVCEEVRVSQRVRKEVTE